MAGLAVRVGGVQAGGNSLADAGYRPDIGARRHGLIERSTADLRWSDSLRDVTRIREFASSELLLVTCANENGLKVRGRTVSGEVE